MDVLQQLSGQGVLIVNSPRTIEASVDKYLSLALLKKSKDSYSADGCLSNGRTMDSSYLTNLSRTWLSNRFLEARAEGSEFE